MYNTDNNERVVNFIQAYNATHDTPWRFDPPLTNIVFPPGTTPEQKIITTIQVGYNEGALYRYAPSPGIIHCPGDARIKLRAGKGFTYVSLSGVGTLNGEAAELYKSTEIQSPSERFLWVEENDPRGENLGS